MERGAFTRGGVHFEEKRRILRRRALLVVGSI
jgi:hypothetical protein